MAKLVISFDSYEAIDGYEGRQAMGQARVIPGVKAVKVYRADSQPRYVVEMETEDDKLEEIKKAIEGYMAPYRGYLSNYGVRVLKEMSL